MTILGDGGLGHTVKRLHCRGGLLRYQTGDRPVPDGLLRSEMTRNVPVAATMRLTGAEPGDVDTGYGYRITPAGALDILTALADGRFHLCDGRIEGRFSLRHSGGVTYIMPAKLRGQALQQPADAACVPDLTDFVMNLGKAGIQ